MIIKPAIFGFLIVALASVGAIAAPKSASETALAQACSGDLAALCPNANADSPEIEECFRQHMKDLSPACGKAVAEHKGAAEKARQPR